MSASNKLFQRYIWLVDTFVSHLIQKEFNLLQLLINAEFCNHRF